MNGFKPTKTIRFIFAATCLLLAISPLRAQDCSFNGNTDAFWNQLQDHFESPCFRNRVDEWKAENLPVDADGATQSANIIAGWNGVKAEFEQVRESVDSLQSSFAADDRIGGDPLGKMITRAELALDELKSIAGVKPFSTKEIWEIEWRGNRGLPPVDLASDVGAQGGIVMKDFLDGLCAAEAKQGGGSACDRTSALSDSLMYSLAQAVELGAASGVKTINQVAAEVAGIDREWDQFLFEGKPMYWLDLLATDLFADYGNADGGFKRPPKYQVFFLHPAPALTYIKDAPDGEQFVPSVYLEIIGVNKWRSKRFSGISVIASYSDNASTDDLGYGLLVTWNSKYSLGVVKYDQDTAISVSIDLANAYRDKLKPQLDQIKLGKF